MKLPTIRQAALSMREHYSADGNLVEVDWNSPDRMAARREPLHETDVDFDDDFGPCDGGETIDVDGIRDIPREALKVLLRFIIPPPNRRYSKRWDVATARLALLARMVDLDDIGGMSLAELGQELGKTRALLSLRSLEIVDQLELSKDKLGKQRRTREVYRQSAIESHRRQGHRIKQDEPQPAL